MTVNHKNHLEIQDRRDFRRSLRPTPCFKEEPASKLHQVGQWHPEFWKSPEREILQTPWATCPKVLPQGYKKEFFPLSSAEISFAVAVASPRRAWLCLLLLVDPFLGFSSPGWTNPGPPACPSLSHITDPITFVALCWTLFQFVSNSPLAL